MRLHFIRSPKVRNPVLDELYVILRQRSHDVTESIPDDAILDLDSTPQHDVFILKARTKLAMGFAGALHQRGARLLDPYPACALLLNKVIATSAMRRAGIPTPRSWALCDPSLLRSSEMSRRWPLVLKPVDGIHSQGVRVVRRPEELVGTWFHGPILVQEFIEGCTERLKVHCVGERVFATCKPFSLGGRHERGEPREVGDELRDIAVRCGRLFGMSLYGLDVLTGADGPVVVDVNSFPGYSDVPGIAPILADHIEQHAHGSAEPDVERRGSKVEIRKLADSTDPETSA